MEPMSMTRSSTANDLFVRKGLEAENNCLKSEVKHSLQRFCQLEAEYRELKLQLQWDKEFDKTAIEQCNAERKELVHKLNAAIDQHRALQAKIINNQRKLLKESYIKQRQTQESPGSSSDPVIESHMAELGAAKQLQSLVNAQAAALAELGIRCVIDSEGAYTIESECGSPMSSLQARIQELVSDQKKTTARLNELTEARADQDKLMQLRKADSAKMAALLKEVLQESKNCKSLLEKAEQDKLDHILQTQKLEKIILIREKEYHNLEAQTKDLGQWNQNLKAQIQEYDQDVLGYKAKIKNLEGYIHEIESQEETFEEQNFHLRDIIEDLEVQVRNLTLQVEELVKAKTAEPDTECDELREKLREADEKVESLTDKVQALSKAQVITKQAQKDLEANPPQRPQSIPTSPSTAYAAGYVLVNDADIPELRLPSPMPAEVGSSQHTRHYQIPSGIRRTERKISTLQSQSTNRRSFIEMDFDDYDHVLLFPELDAAFSLPTSKPEAAEGRQDLTNSMVPTSRNQNRKVADGAATELSVTSASDVTPGSSLHGDCDADCLSMVVETGYDASDSDPDDMITMFVSLTL
ncbi:hypothetical protein HD806DRAFT_550625 [Xylariaceae sp. AK1471]|nr:hypothetical protein HD806DRAFT_550625 [Xylariaceae sp. AK1471]